MDTNTIAIICAGLGAAFSVVYVVFLARGAQSVREVRDTVRRRRD